MNNTVHITQNLTGYYKVGVVSPDEKVEWKQEGHNLILNQGMDNLYNSSVVDQMDYSICGVGTRPNSKDSGASQVSQSGATVYLNNISGLITDFTSSFDVYPALMQVGDMMAYSNGSQSMVTAVNPNGVNLTVTPSYTFSPGQTFTVWKTSQVGLQSEISRSVAYVTSPGGSCGTTVVSNATGSLVHQRTYDFPILQSQMSYNEIGVGWATSGASTVFSRILINPVTVFQGFRLRIIYQLQTAWSQTGSLNGIASIGGWPVPPSTTTNGTQSVQNFLYSSIDGSGNSLTSLAALDPFYTWSRQLCSFDVGIYQFSFAFTFRKLY